MSKYTNVVRFKVKSGQEAKFEAIGIVEANFTSTEFSGMGFCVDGTKVKAGLTVSTPARHVAEKAESNPLERGSTTPLQPVISLWWIGWWAGSNPWHRTISCNSRSGNKSSAKNDA